MKSHPTITAGPLAIRLLTTPTQLRQLLRHPLLARHAGDEAGRHYTLQTTEGLAIDWVLAPAGIGRQAHRQPVSEIVLTLMAGDPGRLFDFVLELQDLAAFRLGSCAIETGTSPRPLPSNPAVLDFSEELRVEQGLQAIAAHCLAHAHGNAAGVCAQTDPEYLHQMRVGLRRLRCALGLFGALAPLPEVLQEELNWLGVQLGIARDWEVLSGTTLGAVMQAAPAATELAAVRNAASMIARTRSRQAAAAVDSERYVRLMLGLSGWLYGTRWRTVVDAAALSALDAPLKPFAATLLTQGQRRILKRGRHLDGADPHARHRVRIAAKKIRYAMEFFHSLYRPRQVRRYVAALSALQDALGWLNDAAVADGLLQELGKRRKGLAGGIGFARGHLASATVPREAELGKLWQRFAAMQAPATR